MRVPRSPQRPIPSGTRSCSRSPPRPARMQRQDEAGGGDAVARCGGPTARAPRLRPRGSPPSWSPDGSATTARSPATRPERASAARSPGCPTTRRRSGSRFLRPQRGAQPTARRGRRERHDAPCPLARWTTRGTSGSSTGRREDRPHDEEQPVSPVTPVQEQPADREYAVDDRSAHGDVPNRKTAAGERRQACPRIDPRCECREDDDRGDERRRPEREQRGRESAVTALSATGRHGGRAARAQRPVALLGLARCVPTPSGRAESVSQLRRQIRRAWTRRGIERERVDCSDEASRKPAPLGCERRCALLDREGDLLIGTPQNGWRSVRVSQSSTPTDQTSLCGVASLPSRRSGRCRRAFLARRRPR